MNERDIDVMNKGRQLRLSLPELLPVLEKQMNNSMLVMFGNLNEGKDITVPASKMCAFYDLKQEILRTVKAVERLEGELHGSSTRE